MRCVNKGQSQTFSIPYSVMQLLLSECFTIDNVSPCQVIENQQDVDASFLLPFFHCNSTIKKLKKLTNELGHAETLNKVEAKDRISFQI